jgi:RNA polymerase primary sigma factor
MIIFRQESTLMSLESPIGEDLIELERLDRQVLQLSGGFPHPVLTPEENFRVQEAKEKIDEILATLSPREELVVRRHIMAGETLKEVGKDLDLSGSRIQQIAAQALRKLRHPRCSRRLQEFVEG